MTAPLPVPDDAVPGSAPEPGAGGAGTGVRAGAVRGLRPVLRLVPDPAALSARVGRLPFLLLVLGLLAGGLLLLLMLNTELAQGSFRAHEQGERVAALEQRAQELQVEVDRRETPEQLAARAAALGLRPGGVPGFVRVPGGEVLRGPEGDDVPLVPFQPEAPSSRGESGSSADGSAAETSGDEESATEDTSEDAAPDEDSGR